MLTTRYSTSHGILPWLFRRSARCPDYEKESRTGLGAARAAQGLAQLGMPLGCSPGLAAMDARWSLAGGPGATRTAPRGPVALLGLLLRDRIAP